VHEPFTHLTQSDPFKYIVFCFLLAAKHCLWLGYLILFGSFILFQPKSRFKYIYYWLYRVGLCMSHWPAWPEVIHWNILFIVFYLQQSTNMWLGYLILFQLNPGLKKDIISSALNTKSIWSSWLASAKFVYLKVDTSSSNDLNNTRLLACVMHVLIKTISWWEEI